MRDEKDKSCRLAAPVVVVCCYDGAVAKVDNVALKGQPHWYVWPGGVAPSVAARTRSRVGDWQAQTCSMHACMKQ